MDLGANRREHADDFVGSRTPITIGGAFSSPYSLKMRAVLRYRHIPFRSVLRNSRWDDSRR